MVWILAFWKENSVTVHRQEELCKESSVAVVGLCRVRFGHAVYSGTIAAIDILTELRTYNLYVHIVHPRLYVGKKEEVVKLKRAYYNGIYTPFEKEELTGKNFKRPSRHSVGKTKSVATFGSYVRTSILFVEHLTV